MAKRKRTAIDLFSGCGGLTQGLKQAGFRVLAAVEIDGTAASTYRMNHPHVHLINDDIKTVDAGLLRKRLELRCGELDLVAACPPCQGFSTLTTKNGARRVVDERNALIFDVLTFVARFRPRAVMLENVPKLADKQEFRSFVRSLKRYGYTSDFRILNAAKFGVPQRRRRLILVAFRDHKVTFAREDAIEVSVRTAIGDLPHPRKSKDLLHRDRKSYSTETKARIRGIPLDGGNRFDLPPQQRLECHDNTDGFRDVYGRMWWDKVSPTITSGCINPSKGRFLHPGQHRPITLREAALLQTFPQGYEFDLSRGRYAVAEMIGNALPPEFIRRHAEAIRDILDE